MTTNVSLFSWYTMIEVASLNDDYVVDAAFVVVAYVVFVFAFVYYHYHHYYHLTTFFLQYY